MTERRLTPEIELEGISADETFAVLGDETRLDIVRVLWEAGALRRYDDLDDTAETLSFTELRRRVDIEDNGRFNYHLSKLTPHFVRQTEEGYRLSRAGKKIARTVIAISDERNPDLSGEMSTECPICGGSVTATYEDNWLRVSCTECDGLFGDAAPEGTLLNSPFPSGGLADRTADEALAAGLFRCMLDLTYMMQGVCRECAGLVVGSASVCEDHDTESGRRCEACGTPFEAWGELQCENCRFTKRLPIELCVLGLAPVVGFLYARGLNPLSLSFDELVATFGSDVCVSVTDDPARVTATVRAEGDELTLTLDDRLAVVDGP